ncbi:MAG: hypothetical protein UHD05_02900, partial [Ruminococcus sp.]|nr:hypothetical protein [Ruminococcus sp.]
QNNLNGLGADFSAPFFYWAAKLGYRSFGKMMLSALIAWESHSFYATEEQYEIYYKTSDKWQNPCSSCSE